jgi:hypothetical protein
MALVPSSGNIIDALVAAVSANSTGSLKSLVEGYYPGGKWDINSLGSAGETALHAAIRLEREDCLNIIIAVVSGAANVSLHCFFNTYKQKTLGLGT